MRPDADVDVFDRGARLSDEALPAPSVPSKAPPPAEGTVALSGGPEWPFLPSRATRRLPPLMQGNGSESG